MGRDSQTRNWVMQEGVCGGGWRRSVCGGVIMVVLAWYSCHCLYRFLDKRGGGIIKDSIQNYSWKDSTRYPVWYHDTIKFLYETRQRGVKSI